MNNYNPPCGNNVPRRSCSAPSFCGAPVAHHDTDRTCRKSPFPVNTALAMAYVPFQQSSEVYSYEKALSRGTVFPCLDKPFLMGCCK